MSRTFTHTDEGVNINGVYFDWPTFDRLEPSYHWDPQFPQRIYRVDGEVPSSIDPRQMLTQGSHVLIEPNGKRHNQDLPSAILDTYIDRLPEYKKRVEDWRAKEDLEAYRKVIEDYKTIVREQCVDAKTKEQKADVEAILQEIDDNWGERLKVIVLGRKLEKYYGWEPPVKG